MMSHDKYERGCQHLSGGHQRITYNKKKKKKRTRKKKERKNGILTLRLTQSIYIYIYIYIWKHNPVFTIDISLSFTEGTAYSFFHYLFL